MPHAYTNGVVTFYEDVRPAGDGPFPAVVLIHGYAADLRLWDEQMPALVDAGFRGIRYDIRGHGRSMIAPDGYTWENYSADLRDLLDRINVEGPTAENLAIEAAHVVGLSMGGGVALQFALDHPARVKSLTLVDSTLPGFAYGEQTSRRIMGLVDAVRDEGPRRAFERLWLTHPFFDGLRRDPKRFAKIEETILAYQAPDLRDGARPPEYRHDVTGRLGEITVPTYVIVGEKDVEDFHLVAGILAENLPNARRSVIQDCWHLPPMEKPAEFNEMLISFLRATEQGQEA